MDLTVDPCQDFYMVRCLFSLFANHIGNSQYSCGGFIRSHHPSNFTQIDIFSEIANSTNRQLLSLLQDRFPLLSDLFDGCMNVDEIETLVSTVP